MSDSISEQLLAIIRSTLLKKKMNTAALAGQMGYSRKEIKKILSGKTPLLVEDFANIARVLELEQDLLNSTQGFSAEDQSEEKIANSLKTIEADEDQTVDFTPRPLDNHAQQMLLFGFGLGVDILLMLDGDQLDGSNIPDHIRDRFPSKFPVRLDALYHDKMKLRTYELAFEILLSFDGLYECIIPWSAVEQVVLFPIQDDEPSEESSEEHTGPHLRLV